MASDYFRWKTTEDASFYLELVDTNGTGKTGETPRLSIRRSRDLTGSQLDNYYWDGVGFSSSITFLSMVEVDATGSPGLYHYQFSQSAIQQPYVYNVYYTSSLGYDVENHMFESPYIEVSSSYPIFAGDLHLYESEPDPSR